MKKMFFLIVLALMAWMDNASGKESIRLNQIGYYPKSNKIFVVADSDATSFEIKSQSGKSVFKSKLSAEKFWEVSGEKLKTGDFSKLETPGVYKIELNNGQSSYEFEIKSNLYNSVTLPTLKTFYFQRMSIPIEEKYAGIYHRPAGHPDTACFFHPSSGYSQGQKASPGGWYDAGDYNKYIVNAGITLGFLLQTNALYPNWVPDGSLNIPESGNGKNDLLDEVKFELDWMFTMQDTDGGVFFKLTNLSFDPFEMPDKTVEKRYFVGKSTTSALCFAASFAQAARSFKNDKEYSIELLTAAEKAWKWAVANPAIAYKNPKDVLTGEYGDNNFNEEFFWAAAELFVTTGQKQYQDAVKKYFQPFQYVQGDNWRFFLGELAYYSLLSKESQLPAAEKTKLKNSLVKAADSLILKMGQIPYRIPMERFTWGSNSDITDASSIFAFAYKLTGDNKYMTAALETMDYIFGKNATGFSFVTGYGDKPVMNVHHRLSGADGIIDPIPGFLSGGPNSDRPDEGDQAWHVKYPLREPARSFIDDTKSFASNEIAINWNAPLFFILSFFENEIK